MRITLVIALKVIILIFFSILFYYFYYSESDSEEEEFQNEIQQESQFISSKDGNINWKLEPYAQTHRHSSSNVIKTSQGPTRYATSQIKCIKSSFQAIFYSTIENKIIQATNIEGRRIYGDDWKEFDNITFQAYIGLLLLAGVYKSNGEATKSLWNKETGRAIFRATMSLEKFTTISRVIRFDDKANRIERRRTDKLAAVREIWDKWVEVVQKLYYPGENVTVDEQLVAFRGRCPFKQYIPSKPAKYGVKIWTLCDSKSSYVLKSQVYTGKEQGEKPEKNQGMRVVFDLTNELKGHNITCDNFFSSYKLAHTLLKRKLTMLGTVRKNKPELPKPLNNKEIFESKFYFTKDVTIVNYIPKRNKNVILMSTMHNIKEISNRPDKKPQMILDYNATKGAVDTLDQLVGTYTVRRKTNRWPMIIFYNMLDISAYNAYVLWHSINPNWNRNKLTGRRIFLEELGKLLITPYIINRQYKPRTVESCNIFERMKSAIPNSETFRGDTKLVKRARCKFCPSNNDNKTNMLCFNCKKHICKYHVIHCCPTCHKN